MNKKEYFYGGKIKGRVQQAIAPATAAALSSFCEQEPEFEQAIEQSGKTFQECLDEVAKGVSGSISLANDYDVRRLSEQLGKLSQSSNYGKGVKTV